MIGPPVPALVFETMPGRSLAEPAGRPLSLAIPPTFNAGQKGGDAQSADTGS